MIEAIYKIYKQQRSMIAETDWAVTPDEKSLLGDMKLSHKLMDEKEPEYRERYEREHNG